MDIGQLVHKAQQLAQEAGLAYNSNKLTDAFLKMMELGDAIEAYQPSGEERAAVGEHVAESGNALAVSTEPPPEADAVKSNEKPKPELVEETTIPGPEAQSAE